MVNINDYELEIKRHVFIRAMQRGISPDLIEATLRRGKQKRFGKNYIRFVKGKVICVGQIIGNIIKIITIERKERK